MDLAYILSRKYAQFQWDLNGDKYDGLNWKDKVAPKPTEVELQQAYDTYVKDFGYIEKRAREYPAIVDQLDMLWHAIDTGVALKSSDFYTTLKAVKDKYPKGA